MSPVLPGRPIPRPAPPVTGAPAPRVPGPAGAVEPAATSGQVPPVPPDARPGPGDGGRPRRGLLLRIVDAARAANAARVPF